MGREGNLSLRDLPNMEVVDALDVLNCFDSCDQLIDIDRFRSCFHKNCYAFFANRSHSEKHDNRENESADEISYHPRVIFAHDSTLSEDSFYRLRLFFTSFIVDFSEDIDNGSGNCDSDCK